MDLEALVTDELRDDEAALRAGVVRRRRRRRAGRRTRRSRSARRTATVVEGNFTGDGPIDAIFRAINAATKIDARLREFRVDAVTGGQDALGEVSVVVELGDPAAAINNSVPGVLAGERVTGAGQAVATDIIEAAAIAYIRAITSAVRTAHAAAEADGDERAALLATP